MKCLNKKKFFWVIVVLGGFLLLSTKGESFDGGYQTLSFDSFLLKNLEFKTDANHNQYLSLMRQSYFLTEKQKRNSLHFTFDEKDSASHINLIESASFRKKTYKDSAGVAATFDLPSHKLILNVPDFSFLSQSHSTGDFSIHMRLRFFQTGSEMEILRKIGIFEGKKQGLRALFHNGKIRFEFYNFFWQKQTPLELQTIDSADVLRPQKFYSVLLTYKESNGSLSLSIDGKEQARFHITSDFSHRGTVLLPKFHRWDHSKMIVGENFFGAIDDLILSNEILSYQEGLGTYGIVKHIGNRFEQASGVFISKRQNMKYSAGKLKNFQVEAEIPPAGQLHFFVRWSDVPFQENTPEQKLPFQKIENGEKFFAQGKYYQWKAEFFSDGQGKSSPLLKKILVQAVENPPPAAPQNLQVVSTSNEAVTLRFIRNSEFDVIHGGRYHVYYGMRPYQPLGILRYQKITTDQKIPFSDTNRFVGEDARFQNYIEITISNQTIKDNFLYTKDHPRWRFDYPLLQSKVPLYFWITALDSSYDEKPEHDDHESLPSQAVVAIIK